jgi:DNA processing protein
MSSTQAWISLDLLPAIGPRTARRLIQTFRSPEAVFAAPAARISGLDFLNARQKEAILAGPDEERVRQILQTLDAMGARAVCLDDPAYPGPLREIHDPPCVLYVKGDLQAIQPAGAIVGTRSPTLYGRETAFRLADLSSQGVPS